MSKYGMFLVHKVSNWVDAWGSYNSDQIQEIIDKLQQTKESNDKFDLVLANLYSNKCGKKVEDILDVLKAGQWMSAQEALDYGFIDEIIEDADDMKTNFAGLSNKISRLGYPALPQNVVVNPKEGLLHAILNKVQDIFDEIGKNRADKDNSQDNQNQIKMTDRKEFSRVNAILGCESLAFNEQGTLLNEEQVQKIEAAQNQLAEQIETLNKEKEALAEQVKNLQAAAGAETNPCDNQQGEDQNIIAEAQALYNSIA
jgi:enoyl-CoA hydratase/carnithine racemase